jgi:hypothetical protein
MQYVGCTITSFTLRFNNHKSSLNRYDFLGEGHSGLSDLMVQIIHTTDVNKKGKVIGQKQFIVLVHWGCRKH